MYERLDEITLAEQEVAERYDHSVNVCMAAGCMSSRSGAIKEAIDKEVEANGLERRCRVRGVGCMGLCAHGPLVAVDTGKPAETMYQYVTPEDASAIVGSLDTTPVERLRCPTDVPFFQRQHKIVLENSGLIDPERIEEYIAADGYTALIKAITEMSPAEVIDEMITSGLRGRGGAGYPTGLKWTTVAKSDGETKYVICNADEGDPGAFMDRSVLESDPHRVLEGMAIAGYAVGASQGYIYVRGRVPAGRQAPEDGHPPGAAGQPARATTSRHAVRLRHRHPPGRGRVRLRRGDGADRLHRGRRGQPRPRPPYPAEYGLWGRPTADQQRRDPRQHRAHHPQRRRVVRQHRHGEEQGHQGLCPGRPGEQHRPDRSADGHHPARDRLRHRRRHPGRPEVQGRADRRPVRRLHPGRVPRHAGGATSRCRRSAPSWARAA